MSKPIDVPGAMLSYLTKKQEEARKAAEAAEAKENGIDLDDEQEATTEAANEELAVPTKVNKRPKEAEIIPSFVNRTDNHQVGESNCGDAAKESHGIHVRGITNYDIWWRRGGEKGS